MEHTCKLVLHSHLRPFQHSIGPAASEVVNVTQPEDLVVMGPLLHLLYSERDLWSGAMLCGIHVSGLVTHTVSLRVRLPEDLQVGRQTQT